MKCCLLENVNFSFCLAKEEHRPTSKSNKSIVDSSKLKISKYKGTFTFKQIKNLVKCLIILKSNKYINYTYGRSGYVEVDFEHDWLAKIENTMKWTYICNVCIYSKFKLVIYSADLLHNPSVGHKVPFVHRANIFVRTRCSPDITVYVSYASLIN